VVGETVEGASVGMVNLEVAGIYPHVSAVKDVSSIEISPVLPSEDLVPIKTICNGKFNRSSANCVRLTCADNFQFWTDIRANKYSLLLEHIFFLNFNYNFIEIFSFT